jgi:methyltransferase
MNAGLLLLAFVAFQRGLELIYARRNTRRLMARGAVEVAPRHYPVMVALHAAWLGGLFWLAPGRPAAPALILLYAIVQVGRLWVLFTLKDRWTTRIVVLPGAPLVREGPYRFVDHPNYIVAALEIALLPSVFGLWEYALLFTLANAALMAVRIPAEDRALRASGGRSPAP